MQFMEQHDEITRANESQIAIRGDLLKVKEELHLVKLEKDELILKLQKLQEEMEKGMNEKFMLMDDLKCQNELLKVCLFFDKLIGGLIVVDFLGLSSNSIIFSTKERHCHADNFQSNLGN